MPGLYFFVSKILTYFQKARQFFNYLKRNKSVIEIWKIDNVLFLKYHQNL